MEFAEWMKKVDAAMLATTGVVSADIDDYEYADAFEEGVTPLEAAMAALENAGFEVEHPAEGEDNFTDDDRMFMLLDYGDEPESEDEDVLYD